MPHYQQVPQKSHGVSVSLTSLILAALGVAMIIIGQKNLDNCPENHIIPILLIVGGSLYIANFLLSLLMCCGCPGSVWVQLTGLLILAWNIVLIVYTFQSNSTVSFEPHSSHYCDKTTFYMSYIVAAVTLVFLAIQLAIFLCCCCCTCCGLRSEERV